MTLQELYTSIEGNYEQAQRVLKMDKLIDRYIRKLKNSGVNEQLAAAAEKMDPTGLFESAHAMKGVCANLGLDELAALADEITEEFRPGNSRTMDDAVVSEKLAALKADYDKSIAGIQAFAAEQ